MADVGQISEEQSAKLDELTSLCSIMLKEMTQEVLIYDFAVFFICV